MAVILRPIDPTDLDDLFEQQRDPEANRMAAFGAPDPDDRAAFDRRWQRILSDESVAVRTIEVDGRVAGSMLLWRDPALDAPEVSYWIGRDFWGQGVATEAVRQFIAAISDRPLYGRAASTNPGSIKCSRSAASGRSTSTATWRPRMVGSTSMSSGWAANRHASAEEGGGPRMPTDAHDGGPLSEKRGGLRGDEVGEHEAVALDDDPRAHGHGTIEHWPVSNESVELAVFAARVDA